MDQTSTPSYVFEGFRLDTVLQVLSAPTGEPIALPSRAFETLRYLVERSGELVEKSTLMKAVWPHAVVEENNLNQCIFTLRKVFGEAAGERRFILTVPGRGFKFVAPVIVIPNSGREALRADAAVLAREAAPAEPITATTAVYFSVQNGNHRHLWRQRSPDGPPQQITFGPTDEETVACAPDGRSLLTSLGREQSTIWLHAAGGERVLTTESYAYSPWLSSDAARVYYLAARSAAEPSGLWRVEVASGNKQSLLAGFAIGGYDISRDEKQVVFTTVHDGLSQIWIAPLDRHAAPSLLIPGGDQAAFDDAGDIFFRKLEEHANFLHRMKSDGSSNVLVLASPIVEFHAVAPDGRWVSVDLPIEGGVGGSYLAPVGGGAPTLMREGWWPSQWSRDGHTLYVEVGAGEDSQRHARTAALPIGPDGLPSASATSVPDAALIPHPELNLAMGPDPSVYGFVKFETRRNIYRIPLHN